MTRANTEETGMKPVRKESQTFEKANQEANPESSNGDGAKLNSCSKSLIKQQIINKEFIKGKYNESFHDGLYRF